MNANLTCCSLAVVVQVLAATGTLAAQKPVITGQVISEYEPSPETLDGLLHSADAVVRGTVTAMRNTPQTDGQGHFAAKTEYTLTLTEIVNGRVGLAQGTSVTVVREGGDVDLGDKISRSVDPAFAPFQIGEQYILFLHWNGYLSKYQVNWGPDGAFHVSAGLVETMGRAPLSRQLHGQRVAALLAALKKP